MTGRAGLACTQTAPKATFQKQPTSTPSLTLCHVTGAEDQVSANQEVERSKMERDYQAQMAALSEELNRVRQELTSRTQVMGQEMERWRQTAEATSRHVQ